VQTQIQVFKHDSVSRCMVTRNTRKPPEVAFTSTALMFMWASPTLYLHIFTVHIISSPKPSHSILQGITNWRC